MKYFEMAAVKFWRYINKPKLIIKIMNPKLLSGAFIGV